MVSDPSAAIDEMFAGLAVISVQVVRSVTLTERLYLSLMSGMALDTTTITISSTSASARYSPT